MKQQRFSRAGTPSRKVSCLAGDDSVSAEQETLCPKFPVGKKHQWRYTKQETFPIKKIPAAKERVS